MTGSTKLKTLLKTIILLSLLPNSTPGFGQNKVQYSNFSWKMLRSPHFYLYYHQEQDSLPNILFHWSENAFSRLSSDFKYTPKNRFPLIIYGDPNLFAQTNIITEVIPEGVGGFTEMYKNRIVIPFTGNYSELRHVIHHELVHAFCFSILYNQFGGSILRNTEQSSPLWFMEGLAEYLSSDWNIEADMFMIDQTIHSTVPLPGIELGGYLAYKGGQSFLYYLSQSRGDALFEKFLENFKQTRSSENSIKNVYGKNAEALGREWIQELKRNYWPEIGKRELPNVNSVAITDHKESHDNYNLRPRLSPDGSKIAFFSDLKDFSKILITDRKGKLLSSISQTGYGGYFESFHPFRSGLSWSPDGNSLAFVTKGSGNDEIRIVSTINKKVLRKIKTSLTSISSPDWSKDGKLLVFTGIQNGRSDLYLYNLDNNDLQRLSNDVNYESDPRFFPDNKRIIFSTEDTSGAASKPTGPYGTTQSDLAVMDIASGSVSHLTQTPWNEKQACISNDNKNIIFVCDRNGIDNLYCAPSDSLQNAKPVTDFTGGCSNPDISDQTLVYTLFQKSGWDVWMMDSVLSHVKTDTLALTRWVESRIDTSKTFFTHVKPPKIDTVKKSDTAAVISKSKTIQHHTDTTTISIQELPSDSNGTLISTNKKSTVNTPQPGEIDTASNLPVKADTMKTAVTQSVNIVQNNSTAIKTDTSVITAKKDTTPIPIPSPQPLKLSFSPDIVSLGLGINTFYGYAGQWVVSLSDLLGDHRFVLAGDVQGNFKDYLHLYGAYYYLKRRTDFGGGIFYSKDLSYANIYADFIYKNIDYGGFFTAEYPFSLYSRVNFEMLYSHSERIPQDTVLPTVDRTTLLPTLSYTFDNILWGITGPINGVRATIGGMVSPPIDMVNESFISSEADVRAYIHIVKRFVWANRLFLGASRSLDKNKSARRYFLGGNDNWLFYEVNLDEYEKNIDQTTYSDFVTPMRGFAYIGLSGTRVALFNSEFRFPFIREISVVWPLPMQIRYISGAFFTDIGNAWDKDKQLDNIPLPDKLYGGIGFGLRANLGIFILRYDRGWPTDFRTWLRAPTNYFSLGAEF
jgi:Tol biopolymer transport system component